MRCTTGLPHARADAGGRARGRLRRAAGVALALTGIATAANALDLVAAKPPIEITDHRASIGGRSLALPEGGRWFYVNRETQDLRGGTRDSVLTSRLAADLVQVDHGMVVLGLRLQLQRDDLFQIRWGREACREADDVFASERAASPQSDCLRATRAGAAFDRAFGGPGSDARRWQASAQVRAPQAGVAVVYERQAANTFGRLDVVVPAERLDGDAAAIAWAETLRTALKPMFEHVQDEARLPPLPQSLPTAAAGMPPGTVSPAAAPVPGPSSETPPAPMPAAAPSAPAPGPASPVAPPPAPSAPRQWGDR